jgi:ABC-2 type transport system permease protein
MRVYVLTIRNLKEISRDPLSLGIAVALPLALLLTLQALGSEDIPFMQPTLLTPGIVLFGFVMVMFSSAMIMSKDRETAFLSRLLATPLRPAEFVAGYSVPYVVVALVQASTLFAVGWLLGLEIDGSVLLVAMMMFLMAVFFVALGMIFGSFLTLGQVSGAYALVLLLTIFGGAWFDLEEIGGMFLTIGDGLPFKHALDATRAVMADGAGLGDIANDLYWMIGYTVAALALAVAAFRRRMVE